MEHQPSNFEASFRTIAEAASDGIITIDAQSTILFANAAVERTFGYPLTELLGQSLTKLMPDYLRKIHEAGLRRYIETGKRHIHWAGTELPGLRKDGTTITLEVSFGEFTQNGGRFFTGIVRDFSTNEQVLQGVHILLVEDETDTREMIARALEQFGASVAQASSAAEALKEFAMTVPHVLISDIGMPLMDGYELLEALRRKSPRVPPCTGTHRLFEPGRRTACAGFRVSGTYAETRDTDEADISCRGTCRKNRLRDSNRHPPFWLCTTNRRPTMTAMDRRRRL